MRSARRSTISSTVSEAAALESARFRAIFRRAHADHSGCQTDEWLMRPCHERDGSPAARSIVWSRRNGPWRRLPVLFVGAAPGNAGGRGRGERGAHGTRIPFGGDVAGANLDVLLASAGLDRNRVFIVAALNSLPARGGGEPSVAELAARVGAFDHSIALLRATMLAAGPALVVALGNLALRSVVAAATLPAADSSPLRLPGLARLEAAGLRRGVPTAWPAAFAPAHPFMREWREAWPEAPVPQLLLCWHPSAQNMSPFAASGTVFHRRMIETLHALRSALRTVHGLTGRAPYEARDAGVYALPEWRQLIAPYHERLAGLWRERGVP
jgi:uracil-DNA glycosylase